MATGAEDHKNMLPNNADHKKKHHGYQRKPLCACTAYSLNKLFVFLHALLFLVVGAVLLIVGICVEVNRQQFRYLDNQLSAPVALLIIIGLFIVVNAILGMLGAVIENLTLLRLFLAFTVVAFCVQIIIGILAFVYREKVSTMTHDHLRFAMTEYTTDHHIKDAVNALQSRFECCGLESYDDYNYNAEYACGSNSTHSCTGAPGMSEGDCGLALRSNNAMSEAADHIHRHGCFKLFRTWLVHHFDVVGALTLGWAIPQIFGMLLVYFFIRRVYDMHVWYRVNAY